MNVFSKPVDETSNTPNCCDTESYRWMFALPRLGWAWEFLRRSPQYRSAFAAHTVESTNDVPKDNSSKPKKPAWFWPIVRLEHPDRDAREANVMWRREACGAVLPLAAVKLPADGTSRQLSFEQMNCRVTIHAEDDRKHVLFAQDGRFLQLEVTGTAELDAAMLVTPALPVCKLATSRLLGVKRLSDVITHGELRSSLYPRERRAQRLVRVVQALDGWLSEAPYREIGAALFGAARVERDWHHPGNHLRDQVRRAIGYGRALMDGGFSRFLS